MGRTLSTVYKSITNFRCEGSREAADTITAGEIPDSTLREAPACWLSTGS